MSTFNTIYKKASDFTKAKGYKMGTYDQYIIFRNEVCIDLKVSCDFIANCDGINHAALAMWKKQKETMTVKAMCRYFHELKKAELND